MTIGIGNEWDPGDPPEIHNEKGRRIMAARGIALGRIIDWAKNADPEEVAYVLARVNKILNERLSRVDRADAAGKTKRTRKAKSAGVAIVHTDEAEHLDAPAKPERGMSA